MTVDAARRTRRRAPATHTAPEPRIAPPTSLAIGELDQTIFECPSCSRPLALGARRCPGCRTRLVAGVTLGKASGFVAVGLAVGMLAGAGGGLVFGFSHGAVAPAPVGTLPSAAPVSGQNGGGTNGGGVVTVTTPTATPAPTPTATTAIPAVTASALTQVIATNGRLAADRAALKAALAARAFDPSAVAQTLRAISAESIFGEQLAGHLTGWSGSSAVGGQLATFYGAVHDAAATGLLSSVRNQAAYRSAATAMIRLLDGLSTLDVDVRAVADAAGVDLAAAVAP
jgi:hypothetical protein